MTVKTIVFQHFPFPSLGHLGEYLDAAGQPYECKVYSDIDQTTSEAMVDADRLILLGSPASVNDDVAWVREVRKIVQSHLAKGKPAFGICFGAQLLASALGADVVRLEQPRVGFRQLGQEAAGGAASGNWFCLHEEHIVPTDQMQPLMVDSGTIYAFKQANVIGIQFHPEMDREVIKSIANELGESDPLRNNLLQSVADFDESSQIRSLKLFECLFSKLSC